MSLTHPAGLTLDPFGFDVIFDLSTKLSRPEAKRLGIPLAQPPLPKWPKRPLEAGPDDWLRMKGFALGLVQRVKHSS